MWNLINRFFDLIFDAFLWPVQSLSSTWQICVLSLPAAAFALLVFKYTSDQKGIERAKDLIKAHLMELRLYKDDLRVTLKAQAKILRYNVSYLRHALIPMAVMIGPFLLMLVQVESRYAHRALHLGESAILSVEYAGETPLVDLETELRLPQGLEQETPVLRIAATREIVWRIGAREAGVHQIGVRLGKVEITKRAVVHPNGARVSPAVYRAGDPTTLLYPGEPGLDSDAPAHAIHLEYPPGRATFAGLSSAAWIFFGASIGLGFLLRPLFGVTF